MLPKIQPALSEYYTDNAEPLSSLLFESIWDKFSGSDIQLKNNVRPITPKILDLGSAQPESFNFYSQHDCYITIADCIQELIALTWPKTDKPNSDLSDKIQEIINTALPRADIKYDVILLWDSLNYIQPKILPFIHNYLLKFTSTKTIVHGFLLTSESCPKQNGIFKILSAKQIHHSLVTTEIVQHSPLTPITINKVMPNFKYSRAVLMRSGLQEFMLTRL